MRPKGNFVQFIEIAKKWGYAEDELIQLALQNEFGVYCLTPIPLGYGGHMRVPVLIKDELVDFLPGKTSISCSNFFIKIDPPKEGTSCSVISEDRPFDTMNPDVLNSEVLNSFVLPEVTMPSIIINRSDLFLNIDEIAEMETKYPDLVGKKANIEIAADFQEQPENEEQSNTKEVTSNISTKDEPVDLLLNNDHSVSVSLSPSESQSGTSKARMGDTFDSEQIAHILLENEVLESIYPSPPEFEMATTEDSHLPFPEENNNKSNSIYQNEKIKKVNQSDKKTIPDQQINVRLVESDKADQADPAEVSEVNLRIWQIIGKNGILPMSRSSWYAGIKSGKYPKPYSYPGNRAAYWKKSEIDELLKKMKNK